MARGFLMGLVWGTVVSGAGVGALSIMTGPGVVPETGNAVDGAGGQSVLETPAVDAQPDGVDADAAAGVVVGGADVAPDAPTADANPDAPPAETVVDAQDVPAVADVAISDAAPAGPTPDPDRAANEAALDRAAALDPARPGRRPPPEEAVALPQVQTDPLTAPQSPIVIGADTTPPAQPEVGAAPEAALEPPPERTDGGGLGIDVTSDGPVLPAAQAEAPGLASPDAGRDAAISPLQPPAPLVPDGQTALVPDADDTAADGTASPDQNLALAAPEAAPAIPDTNVENGPAPIVPEAGITEERPDSPAIVLPEDVPVPDVSPSPEAPVAPALPDNASGDDSDTETADADGGEVSEDAAESIIGRRAVSLVERGGVVTQSRLPRIGATDADPDAANVADTGEDGPLARFAAPIDSDPTQPRLAVILIDDGTGPLGPEALAPLPFPVTFAIDPTRADAAEIAAGYRRAGFEVVSIARLPEGASASDVEVSLAAAIDAVPGAIGLMEAPEGGLQDSREVTTQAAAILAASGHGLVMMPKGLNTAQQLASREGVPTVAVFRDFDGEGQDDRVIRRFLDQAAFRARQDGAVVMLGRLQANTVSALVLWGLQDRASTVSLVPVSQILLNPPDPD